MANTTFKVENANRPAPGWWRKMENILLMVLIPAATGIISGVVENTVLAAKLLLWINTGLVAIVKAVGMMLANGEAYAPEAAIMPTEPDWVVEVNELPSVGSRRLVYKMGGLYYTFSAVDGWSRGQAERPTKPPMTA